MTALYHLILRRRRARNREFLLLAGSLLLQIRQNERRRIKQRINAAAEPTPSLKSRSHTSQPVPQESTKSGPTSPRETTSGPHHSLGEVVQTPNRENHCQHDPEQKRDPQKSLVAPNKCPTDVVDEDRSGSIGEHGYEEAAAAAAAAADATGASSRAPMQATVESGSESDA
ncbi:hypothetical protein NU219Hw_g994t1 [Hortaea werneckii]